MKSTFNAVSLKSAVIVSIFFMLRMQSFASDKLPLAGHAAEVYSRAQGGKWFSDAMKLNPGIIPTSDSQSFIAVWKPKGTEPKHWIVSLHGSRGFATDDLAIWHPHLKGFDVGLVCLQWWIGSDDSPKSYYAPLQIYREIDFALERLGVRPGVVMFHGFSRGSANSYAVAAIDAGRGKHYFSLFIASSGGVGMDYPPTRAILEGKFGNLPLKGTKWITAAGAHDPNPERDGISGMRRTASWLREQGATVLETIEDPDDGHGALMLNTKNARRVLDLFFSHSLNSNKRGHPSGSRVITYTPSAFRGPENLRFRAVSKVNDRRRGSCVQPFRGLQSVSNNTIPSILKKGTVSTRSDGCPPTQVQVPNVV